MHMICGELTFLILGCLAFGFFSQFFQYNSSNSQSDIQKLWIWSWFDAKKGNIFLSIPNRLVK